MPVTPGPGGVEEEHRYTPGSGVRHGTRDTTGRWTRPRTSMSAGAEVPADVVLGCTLASSAAVVTLCLHHHVPEPGREALQLRGDGLAHVHGGTGRHMAVAPQDVPSGGRPAGVETGRLRHQDVGALRVPAGGDLVLRLRQSPPGCRPRALFRRQPVPEPPTAPGRTG